MATPNSILVSWTASTGTPPIYYITQYRVDGDPDWISNPLGNTLNTTQTIFGLTQNTTYNVRVQASNAWGVSYSNVVNYTTPVGFVILKDVISPIEWRSQTVVAKTVNVPIEFFAAAPPTLTTARNFQVNAEWTGATGVTRDMRVQIEIGATPLAVPLQVQNVQLTGPTNTTLIVTWDNNATGPRPTGYQVQWKRSVDPTFINFVPTVPEPPVNQLVVSRTFAVPIEHGGHVTFSRNSDVPLEWRGLIGASRNIVVPVEFGGNKAVTRSFDIPVELRGTTTNVQRNISPSLDWRKAVRSGDKIVGVEWRLTPTPTPAPTPTYVEIDLGDPSTLVDGSGNVWGLDQSDSAGGAATMNGVINDEFKFCDILVYRVSTATIWIQDQGNPTNWYSFFPDAAHAFFGFWVGPSTTDPRL